MGTSLRGKTPPPARRELVLLVEDSWAALPDTRALWDSFASDYREQGEGRARPGDVRFLNSNGPLVTRVRRMHQT
eukprot:1503671-Pyramimonas_sp.AAC.1